jgi:hypothetical protein
MKPTAPILLWIIAGVILDQSLAFASSEYVTVVKVMQNDDKGIIERANGERWLIEKGVGALSFWQCEGRKVVVYSPGIFCGVGSKLILPDLDQEARIWSAERLSDKTTPATGAVPTTSTTPTASTSAATNANDIESVRALATALATLKYFDPASADETKRDAIRALKKFQADHKIGDGGQIGPDTYVKLAELTLRDHGKTVEGLDLALSLITSAKKMHAGLPDTVNVKGVPSATVETFIIYVSGNGAIIKLADGSIYTVDPIGQIKTMLWLPTHKVLQQPDGLLNTTKGESVRATLLR